MQLPRMNAHSSFKTIVSGSDLMAAGKFTIPSGIGLPEDHVDPTAEYLQSNPLLVPVNHKRRMRKLFNKYGAEGLAAYVKGIDEIIQKESSDAGTK